LKLFEGIFWDAEHAAADADADVAESALRAQGVYECRGDSEPFGGCFYGEHVNLLFESAFRYSPNERLLGPFFSRFSEGFFRGDWF
jgi:hypothetical protein